MCRLAYMPNTKDVPFDVAKFFIYLERRAGGSGNGLGWFDAETRNPVVKKGVHYSCAEAAMDLDQINTFRGALFHTRIPSMGGRSDANCHPFMFKKTLTMHNGTWGGARDLKWQILLNKGMSADRLKDCTDSEIIAYLVSEHGFSAAEMVGSGVILTLTPNSAKVVVNGDFEAVRFGKVWYYASTFPNDIGGAADKWIRFTYGTVAELFKKSFKIIHGSATMMQTGRGNYRLEGGQSLGASNPPRYREDLMQWASGEREGPEEFDPEDFDPEADDVEVLTEAQFAEIFGDHEVVGTNEYQLDPEYAPPIDTTNMAPRRGWKTK